VIDDATLIVVSRNLIVEAMPRTTVRDIATWSMRCQRRFDVDNSAFACEAGTDRKGLAQ